MVMFTEDECVVDVGIHHIEVVLFGNIVVLWKIIEENLKLLKVEISSVNLPEKRCPGQIMETNLRLPFLYNSTDFSDLNLCIIGKLSPSLPDIARETSKIGVS